MENIKDSVVGLLATWKVSKDSSNPVWKLVGGLLLAIVTFLVLAYISRKAFKQWRELAELRHEKDVLRQEKWREAVSQRNMELEEEIKASDERIAEINENIEEVDEDIEELNDKWIIENAKIRAIESWHDIDMYNRRTSPTG